MNHNISRSTDFYLLLLYSLLPGIYKILGNQNLMLVSLPILVILFIKDTKHISLKRFDIFFIFYFVYIFALSCVQYFSPKTNQLAILMGFFLDIIPMVGFFYSRKISFEKFVQILVVIAIVHLIIGIFLYPLFGLNYLLGDLTPIFLEGIAINRMSSVSGSLGFASLMMMSSMCALYYSKRCFFLLLVGVIFASQRSGWLAVLWAIFFYIFVNMKRKQFAPLGIALIACFSFICVMWVIVDKMDIDLLFFYNRLGDIADATSERDSQWIGGVKNFIQMPIGLGAGQVGQVASRYTAGNYSFVPDGDYFRILSEFGICGGGFYLICIILFFLSLITLKGTASNKRVCILSIVGGLFIQMVGSNISEFYFNNFIYWCVFGYFFHELNQSFRIGAYK